MRAMGKSSARRFKLGLVPTLLMAVSHATPLAVQAAGHPSPLADVVGEVSLVALVMSRGPEPGTLDSARLSVDRVFKGRAAKTLAFVGKTIATVMPPGSRWVILGDTHKGTTEGSYWPVLPNGRIADTGLVENPGTVQALAAWFASAPATSTQADRGSSSDPSLQMVFAVVTFLLWLVFTPAYLARRARVHRSARFDEGDGG